MKHVRYALGLAAVAASLFGGTASANPTTVCEYRDPAYHGCTYVYVDGNGVCVTGGGSIAGRPYQFAPCH